MSLQSIGAYRPLCFLHVPKTGGTSLTDAIARLYPPGSMLTDGGNLSVEYLSRHDERLRGRVFVAGHAGAGVARYLRGRADIITMVRRPDDQAVSNYLHVLSDPANDLHPAACRQSFSSFLRENIYQICFQSGSLWLAISAAARQAPSGAPGNVNALLRFLDTLPFLGVIERPERCAEVLSRMLPGAETLQLPCLNAAVYRGVSARTLAALRAEYVALREAPDLGYLFALESLVYAKARAALAGLEREIAVAPAPAARAGFLASRRFSTPAGRPEDETCVVPLTPSPAGHMIFGPYDRLPRGRHRVEFHLAFEDLGPRPRGRIQLEILANGSASLGRRWVAVSPPPSRRALTLGFLNARQSNVLEFRVRGSGILGGRMIFRGATVTPVRSPGPDAKGRWLSMSIGPAAASSGLSRLLRGEPVRKLAHLMD